MIKSNLAVVATLILLIPAGLLLAQPNIGVIAGANGAVLKGDAPRGVSYNRSWGLNLSVAGEFELSDDILLCFQPGYSQNGTIVAVEKKDIKDPVDSLDLSLGVDINCNWYRSERYMDGIQYLNYIFSMQYYF